MRQDHDSASHISEAIEAYFAAHPGAADCEKGIADWWLPSMGIRASVTEVRLALERLEQLGVVECRNLPDGRLLYRAVGHGKDLER